MENKEPHDINEEIKKYCREIINDSKDCINDLKYIRTQLKIIKEYLLKKETIND
jgi:hypothetical protein